MVQFNLMARDSYFTNRIEWTEHTITVLKPAKKYQIIQYYQRFPAGIMHFYAKQKFC